jgi:hypothetical protein
MFQPSSQTSMSVSKTTFVNTTAPIPMVPTFVLATLVIHLQLMGSVAQVCTVRL